MLLGALAGAAVTVIAIQQPVMLAGAIAKAPPSDTYRELNLFGDIFERVRSHYVEKPDDSKLIELAINGMLSGLDPHSSYLDAKSLRDMQEQTRGEFGGLGIEVTMEDGLVKVVAPIDDTPAAKAGIRANDLITHIDGEAVRGMTLDRAIEKMRGPVNTKIKLRIMRKGVNKPIDVSLKRAIIRVSSVRSRIEGNDVGYIRITQFNEHTTDGLKKACAISVSIFRPTNCAVTSSICATIRAACSTRQSPSPMPSSTAARSFRPAAAIPRRPSVSTRGQAT